MACDRVFSDKQAHKQSQKQFGKKSSNSLNYSDESKIPLIKSIKFPKHFVSLSCSLADVTSFVSLSSR